MPDNRAMNDFIRLAAGHPPATPPEPPAPPAAPVEGEDGPPIVQSGSFGGGYQGAPVGAGRPDVNAAIRQAARHGGSVVSLDTAASDLAKPFA